MQTKMRRDGAIINLDSDEEVDASIRDAVRDALRQHKRRGESVVVWQDGKVVTLPPEEIPVDEAEE